MLSGGDIEWIRQFGSPESDFVACFAADGAGGVYVAGNTDGTLPGQTSAGHTDVFLRKYDSAGNEVWTRQFGTPGWDSMSWNIPTRTIAVDDSGSVFMGGFVAGTLPGQAPAGGGDAFVRKYDPDGNELWTRQFGSEHDDRAEQPALENSGGVYIAGAT